MKHFLSPLWFSKTAKTALTLPFFSFEEFNKILPHNENIFNVVTIPLFSFLFPPTIDRFWFSGWPNIDPSLVAASQTRYPANHPPPAPNPSLSLVSFQPTFHLFYFRISYLDYNSHCKGRHKKNCFFLLSVKKGGGSWPILKNLSENTQFFFFYHF